MGSVLRLVIGGGACVFVFCALIYFDQMGIDTFAPAETARAPQRIDVDFEAERCAKLDEEVARMQVVVERRQAILRDLVAGSISLLNAGEQFQDLEKVTPRSNVEVLRGVYPGESDRERYCRQVIQNALMLKRLNPSDEHWLRVQLEDQFKRDFANANMIWLD